MTGTHTYRPLRLTSASLSIMANKADNSIRVALPCGQTKDFHVEELEKFALRLLQAVEWVKGNVEARKSF